MVSSAPGSGAASQPQFVPPRVTLLVLLATTAILLLGSGLFGTLIGIRASIEQFPTSLVGLVMSAYFAGFMAGTLLCVHVISGVGHIRAFAVFAAIATATALAQSIWIGVLPWLLFRFVAGLALAGLTLILESWLNGLTTPERRGRTFAAYMVVYLLALAGGQLLLTTADPAGFVLFSVVAMLFALSLVPTAVVRVEAPELHPAVGLGLRELTRRSPVSTAGCLAAGIAGGTFWGMTPASLTQLGYSGNEVALFMFLAIIGGTASQLPVGRYSDGRDRRQVIVVIALLCAASALLVTAAAVAPFAALAAAGTLFGAFMFPVYGLAVARAHDLLTPGQALEATRSLLLVFGVGATVGPFAAGLAMSVLGPAALFAWLAVTFLALSLYSAWRLRFSEALPPGEQSTFVPVIPVTQEAAEMFEPGHR